MFPRGLPYLAFFIALISTVTLPVDIARAARAFDIVAHDVEVDEVNQQTTFIVTFNQPPDFFSTNELGQPDNAFQFFFDAEPADDQVDFAGDDVVIIRGPEIRVSNDIPIRESINPSGQDFPNAEGWGEARGHVDFDLDGPTISFTASWDLLHESDGQFGYHLFALQRGELTNEVTFIRRISVPLPPALLGGAFGLACLAVHLVRPRGEHRRI
jgi:hypothetical protein